MSGSNSISAVNDEMAQVMTVLRANAANAAAATSNTFAPSTNPLASTTGRLPNSMTNLDQYQATPSTSVKSGITTTPESSDTRIRLKSQPQSKVAVYGAQGAGIMSILHETDGMIFPYTPQINFTQDVDYKSQDMSQSNTDYYTYTRTPSVTLSVSGKFTIQNQREGIYALACIHFLRTCSKMYFGEAAAKSYMAGLPPPVLIFNGYGSYMFNNLKVILKNHSFNYDENMDTILVTSAGGTARLPAMFTLSINLIVQQTPTAMRKQFDLNKFRSGELMKQGGWI